MSRTPRVSVGLPVFNGERYLACAIESLLAQSFSDFELIISDNASTDATPEICRGYAQRDSRIRFERQEVNRGAAWNFNRVFHLAQGEFFRWASDDDLCDANYLARCVDVLDCDQSVVWCHSRTTRIDSSNTPLAEPRDQNISYCWAGECDDEIRANRCSPAAMQCEQQGRSVLCRSSLSARDRFAAVIFSDSNDDVFGLIRSAALAETRLQRPYYGADKLFVAELSLLGRFQEVPETLFFKRVHANGSGALSTQKQLQAWIDPSRKTRSSIHVRLQLLRGYLEVIAHSGLDARSRAGCYLVLLRYLLQFHKWKSVIAKAVSDVGTGGGYLKTLQQAGTSHFGEQS